MSGSAGEPILVVGAGPVGLIAAAELARRGVPVRIIDKLPAPTLESRAIVVHARSLEMHDRIGTLDALIESGVKSTALEMHTSGRQLARIRLDEVDSAFPFSVTTAQTETERVLSEFVAGHGVTVERGVELTDLHQDESGVRATVRHAGGGTDVITASFVVGADGARSDVRRLVGTALAGTFQGELFLMGDVDAECSLDRHTMYTYFARHAGPLMVFPMIGDRMRLIAQVDADSRSREPSIPWLQELADDRGGPVRITSARWLTIFEIHHAQVPAYRFGRVFLAGDAAHVHSPAGAQGMNTGMQDAFNLGWKLALAASGQASDELMDSYHAERHPVAARVIRFSTKLTDLATLDSKLARTLRNTAAHALSGLAPVQHALASQAEETDIAYRDSPVVTDACRSAHKLRAGDHLPDVAGCGLRQLVNAETGHVLITVAPGGCPAARAQGVQQVLVTDAAGAEAGLAGGYDAVLADPDRAVAGRFGLRDGGQVMVRPDGYVGYVGDLGTSDAFTAYLSLLGGVGTG